MPSLSVTSRFAALPAAALLLTAGAAPALANDDAYTVQLRQELPRTATSASGGVPQQGADECPGIPAAQDGWHFVLPGGSSNFVKLTVAFEPGGEQVVTEFGPPSDKHAYVASAPGAELTSAVAEVTGGDLELFNLSHTCPAAAPESPGQPAEEDEEGNDEENEEPGEEPGEEPEPEPEKPGDASCEDAADASGERCEETPGTPSDETSDEPSASPSPDVTRDGDLAVTGAGPTIGLAAAAAALLGVGGFLVLRRRRTTAGND
ncbi:LPXTG cell wall anchor domain-containing protein [Streptomyces sp. JJ38]|uniref:LPXTG cell wall anchor domain-containing protein n=1 Tax=Streptomyces sp. JJ38 TaxID=2738128 RepID=UPI001C578079|nr:LPXTG cell wall anchor domain-containing protein [Streptomyces sp. JJ38]MBW1599203.1 LPXTG cell wall anchor domain-containing protein [Streptomyces sp. JJ38]